MGRASRRGRDRFLPRSARPANPDHPGGARPSPAGDYPWFAPWLGGLFLLAVAISGGRQGGQWPMLYDATLARAGFAREVPAANRAEALTWLLGDGSSFRGALAVRRLIDASPSPDEMARVVASEFARFTLRTSASYLLADVGAPAVPLLLVTLQSPKERVRQQAALTLGAIGPRAASAIPALGELASRSPGDTSVVEAGMALAEIGAPGAGPRIGRHWHVRDYEAAVLLVAGSVFLALGLFLAVAAFRSPRSSPSARSSREDRTPAVFLVLVTLAGVALFYVGASDLLADAWTFSADLWFVSVGTWLLGAVLWDTSRDRT